MQTTAAPEDVIQSFPTPVTKPLSPGGIVSLNVPELPNELWLQICDYLPPGVVVKNMGLNRVFYESAMNIVYREIYVADAEDETQNFRLKELQKKPIALRVRCLRIAPHFLPLRDREGRPLLQESSTSNAKFLKRTMKVLRSCKNIEKLSLKMHSNLPHLITTSFCDFLNALVFKSCPGIRKLFLSMSTDQFRVLAALVSRHSTANFTDITLSLLPLPANYPSPGPVPPASDSHLIEHLTTLLNNVAHSLTVLDITSAIHIDLSPVIQRLEGFTALRGLYFSDRTGSHPLSFCKNLIQLCTSSPTSTLFFLNLLATSIIFCKGRLHILPPEVDFDLASLSSVFAAFGCFLNHLVISPSQSLKYVQFQQLLAGVKEFLREQGKETQLEIFELRGLKLLSAKHLDEILRTFPHLKVLVIKYERHSISPSTRERPPSQTRREWYRELKNSFRTHKFPISKLEKLELQQLYRSPGVVPRTTEKPPSVLSKYLSVSLPGVNISARYD